MGHLCAAESCLVPCEGGAALTVAAGEALAARAALGRERLAPRILCRLPVFLCAAARKRRVSSFCRRPGTCLSPAGCGEGDGAEPRARGSLASSLEVTRGLCGVEAAGPSQHQ